MNIIMDQSTRYRYAISTALVVVILLIAQVVRADNPAEKYIEDYRLIAVQEMEKHGIPASITLAQGMLESGYGESLLAKNANNHFGIKCHSNWKGERYYYDDDAEDECFRVYPNAQESFLDHSDFLVGRKRYAKLFTYKLTDYKKWAIELKRAGYATNPDYPSLLISLIKKHGICLGLLLQNFGINSYASVFCKGVINLQRHQGEIPSGVKLLL